MIEYRKLHNHPGYMVGSDGSVWSCQNNRWGTSDVWKPLKQHQVKSGKPSGYARLSVQLGRGARRYVHHLVLEAFDGPRPHGAEACHKDGNPLNNSASNLYWGTRKQNCADIARHATRKGEAHHRAKLNEIDVRNIRKLLASGETQEAIAKQFSVKREAISKISRGTRWAHVS